MCGSPLVRLRMPAPSRGMNEAFKKKIGKATLIRSLRIRLISLNECSPVESPTKESL